MATVQQHPSARLLDVGEILSQLRETRGRILADDRAAFTSIDPRAHMRKTNREHGVQYYGDKPARHEAVHLPQMESVVRILAT